MTALQRVGGEGSLRKLYKRRFLRFFAALTVLLIQVHDQGDDKHFREPNSRINRLLSHFLF